MKTIQKKQTSPILFFSIAAIVAIYLPPGSISRIICLFSALLLCVLLSLFKAASGSPCWPTKQKPFFKIHFSWFWLFSFGLCFGAYFHYYNETKLNDFSLGFCNLNPSSVSGFVASDPKLTAKGLLAFDIELEQAYKNNASITANGLVTIYMRQKPSKKQQTKIIKQQSVMLYLKNPISYSSFYETKTAWDKLLAKPSVFIDSGDLFVQKEAPKLALFREKIRTQFLTAISNSCGKAAPLVEALVMGVKDDLDSDLAISFKNAGCSHILALSGQHVSIISGIVALVIGLFASPLCARFVASLLLCFYLFIVGASPSVFRAIIMFILSSVFIVFDRPVSVPPILASTFVIATILFPCSVYTLSFILSYLAVLGISIFTYSVSFILQRFIPPKIASSLGTGFAAMSGTAAITIKNFSVLNFLSPFSSALASPLVSVIIYCGIASSIIVSIFPFLAPFTSFICNLPYFCIEQLMKYASMCPKIDAKNNELLLSLSVALFSLLLYAWPYVRYLTATIRNTSSCKLRFTTSTFCNVRKPWSWNAQKIWSKLFSKQECSKQNSSPISCT